MKKVHYSLSSPGSHEVAQGCALKAKQHKEDVLAKKLFTANLFRKNFN